MKTTILIMGLPGSGKTTLALALQKKLEQEGKIVCHLNADEVRELYEDWDFSIEGRMRQASRMKQLADDSSADFVISDFVAPIPAMREIYNADFTIFMNTITAGRFEDTNSLFQPPAVAECIVNTQDSEFWSTFLSNKLLAESCNIR